MWSSGGAAPCWCALSDGSGFLNLRFFYFSRAQQEGLHVARACAAWAKCGAARRAWRWCIRSIARYAVQREPLDDRLTPDLSADRRADPGPRAWHGEQGAGSGWPRIRPRICCPPASSRSLHLPTLREALEFVHHPPVGTSLASLADGRPSCAAAPCLRGTAGAPALAATAEAAHADLQMRREAARTQPALREQFVGAPPLHTDRRAAARAHRSRARPAARTADDAAGAG